MAVATIVSWLVLKPSSAAIRRPAWRALTMSASVRIGMTSASVST
jgi:hypothetical protein